MIIVDILVDVSIGVVVSVLVVITITTISPICVCETSVPNEFVPFFHSCHTVRECLLILYLLAQLF